MLENVQWQVRVWWWEVIAYQWECWFTQGARRRLNKRYKVGTVLWGHGRKNYSLYLKWKLEPLVDMTDGPSFPLLYCFGSPNNHHRSCNRPVFETGKLFGLTMCVCVCVCVCVWAARYWTDVRSQLCSLPGLFSLHLIPPTVTRAVSHYGLTIYMKKVS